VNTSVPDAWRFVLAMTESVTATQHNTSLLYYLQSIIQVSFQWWYHRPPPVYAEVCGRGAVETLMGTTATWTT